MFRVVKVTSPMNVGSWVLLVSGGASNDRGAARRWPDGSDACSTAAAIVSHSERAAARDVHRRPDRGHGRPGLARGPPRAAVDLRGERSCERGRRGLDVRPPARRGPARRLAVAGVLAEGALMQAMQLRLGGLGEVYRQGEAAHVLTGGERDGDGRCRAARDPRPQEPQRGGARRSARLRGRAVPALGRVQGGQTVGARSEVRRRVSAPPSRAKRDEGNEEGFAELAVRDPTTRL